MPDLREFRSTIHDLDPDDPSTAEVVADMRRRLDGPWEAWAIVTRDEQRQLARLAQRLLALCGACPVDCPGRNGKVGQPEHQEPDPDVHPIRGVKA